MPKYRGFALALQALPSQWIGATELQAQLRTADQTFELADEDGFGVADRYFMVCGRPYPPHPPLLKIFDLEYFVNNTSILCGSTIISDKELQKSIHC
jgi:hypothetical protein